MNPALETVANGSATQLVVGVADYKVTRDPNASLVTHALGSCIGVTVYDPNTKVGGMLHFMLSSSKNARAKAELKPAMFADTGVPLLFKDAYKLGAKKEDLIVCAAGGAEILGDCECFKIGSRNRTILRKLFWKNEILIASEDTGGTRSRTLQMNMDDGSVEIRSQGERYPLWPTA